jgi:hypothetical protein
MNACVLLVCLYLPKTLSRKQASKKFSAVDQTRPWHRAALLLMGGTCALVLFVLCVGVCVYVRMDLEVEESNERSSEDGEGEGEEGGDTQKILVTTKYC